MFLLLLKMKSELLESCICVRNYAAFSEQELNISSGVCMSLGMFYTSRNVLHKNECAQMRHAAVGSLCSQSLELV